MYANIDHHVPEEFSGMIGDFAHNVRSALNFAVYTASTLPENDPARQYLQFPICDTLGKYTKDKKKWLLGVSAAHEAIIDQAQPYHAGQGAHVLTLLADINNADKHRVLVTVGQQGRINDIGYSGSLATPETTGRKLTNGVIAVDHTPLVEITAPPGEGELQAHVNSDVAVLFWEGCPSVKGMTVWPTLEKIHEVAFKLVENVSNTR